MRDIERAKAIWDAVYNNLYDRGCFNGIDDEIMEEIHDDLIATIADELP